MSKLFRVWLIIATQLLLSDLAFAASNNLYIDSNNLQVDTKNNTAIFTGNVVLCTNDMVLKTSKLRVFYKESEGKQVIDHVVIPNKLKAIKLSEKQVVIADSGRYQVDKATLELNGNVLAESGKLTLKTDHFLLQDH